MKLNKLSQMAMLTMLLTLMMTMNNKSHFSMELTLMSFFNESLKSTTMIMNWNELSTVLVSTILAVSILISFYSKMYFSESDYKKEKIIELTIIFAAAMIVLSMSSSYMLMISSWEMLGISSFFLIIFYPNKTSIFNSKMTMMINRLGDILFLLLMAMSMKLFLQNYEGMKSMQFLMIMILGSMTKSAQFPLSSWLPAAMSAPTPISAMVHSSTLVAAGLVIMMKMYFLFEKSTMNSKILWMVSSFGMIVGGMMAIWEGDFKKIVAFSTMAQISMIMNFLSIGLFEVAIMHMIYHALFKSFLFSIVGTKFIKSLNTQMKTKMKSTNKNKMENSLMFISIFSMTGLMFSSSFSSKHLAMDLMLEEKMSHHLISITLSSLATMIYSFKLFKSMESNMSFMKTSMNKKLVENNYLVMYFIINIMVTETVKDTFMSSNSINISKMETLLMTTMIVLTSLLSLSKVKKSKMMSVLTFNIMMMKISTFSSWGKTMKMVSWTVQSDTMTMKPLYYMIKLKSMKKYYLTLSTVTALMIALV